MKIEMAVLWSVGGGEGTWETVELELPDVLLNARQHVIEHAGRVHIYADPQYDDIAGCYLYWYETAVSRDLEEAAAGYPHEDH